MVQSSQEPLPHHDQSQTVSSHITHSSFKLMKVHKFIVYYINFTIDREFLKRLNV